MSSERPWEELDHPADVRLRIRGRDYEELLENAARAMIEVFIDPSTVEEKETFAVESHGDCADALLVNWLQEILFAFDAERFAPCGVEVSCVEHGTVKGNLRGEKFDPERHSTRTEIKAVTWHDLEIRETNSGLEVTVVFDV